MNGYDISLEIKIALRRRIDFLEDHPEPSESTKYLPTLKMAYKLLSDNPLENYTFFQSLLDKENANQHSTSPKE